MFLSAFISKFLRVEFAVVVAVLVILAPLVGEASVPASRIHTAIASPTKCAQQYTSTSCCNYRSTTSRRLDGYGSRHLFSATDGTNSRRNCSMNTMVVLESSFETSVLLESRNSEFACSITAEAFICLSPLILTRLLTNSVRKGPSAMEERVLERFASD